MNAIDKTQELIDKVLEKGIATIRIGLFLERGDNLTEQQKGWPPGDACEDMDFGGAKDIWLSPVLPERITDAKHLLKIANIEDDE